MTLLSAIAKLQTLGAQYYLQLTKDFAENTVVRETFAKLAQDLERQTAAVQALPRGFWKQFEEPHEVLKAVGEAFSISARIDQEHSLPRCCVRTLVFEEPLILHMYAPVIRRLRMQSSEQGMDFYIMVKAHVARLTRLIQPFSGDPILVGRALNLLQNFEREVQTPEPVLDFKVKSTSRTLAAKALGDPKAREPQKAHAVSKSGRAVPKSRTKRAKPLVKKIVSRRRARR